MSDQQTELNNLTNELACLDTGETVTLVTDDGSIIATVVANRWHPDEAVVIFKDRNADRYLRVHTEYYMGWLDPLVDIYSDSLRPVGTLIDMHTVSTTDDQSRCRTRP